MFASFDWTRRGGGGGGAVGRKLAVTSELAGRLILLIRISSPGDCCCIDWTTKAERKTLQHSIIHTDRHNAILLLPPPLLIPAPSREASVRLGEESSHTVESERACV